MFMLKSVCVCVRVLLFAHLQERERESKRISPYARGCTHVSVWLLAAYLLILDLGLVYKCWLSLVYT